MVSKTTAYRHLGTYASAQGKQKKGKHHHQVAVPPEDFISYLLEETARCGKFN